MVKERKASHAHPGSVHLLIKVIAIYDPRFKGFEPGQKLFHILIDQLVEYFVDAGLIVN